MSKNAKTKLINEIKSHLNYMWDAINENNVKHTLENSLSDSEYMYKVEIRKRESELSEVQIENLEQASNLFDSLLSYFDDIDMAVGEINYKLRDLTRNLRYCSKHKTVFYDSDELFFNDDNLCIDYEIGGENTITKIDEIISRIKMEIDEADHTLFLLKKQVCY